MAAGLEQSPLESINVFCQKFVPGTQFIVANGFFYEKMVISLVLDSSASKEGIQRFLEENFQKHFSIGKISQILNQAADRSAEFDASIDLSSIRQGANDEIFQCGTPVLTGSDPVSTYIYLLQQEEDRSAQTLQATMETCKERNLDLDVSISDFGSGLLSGILKAFLDAIMQPDIFHWLMELGKEISAQERKAYAMLSDYYRWEETLNGKRIHEKTFEKLLSLEEKLPSVLERCDELQILYQWLREMTGYHGYHYEDALSLCRWILKRMEESAGEDCRLKKVLSKTSRNLPSVLACLKRAEEALKAYVAEHGYSPEAFILMYRLQGYQPGSMEYQAVDRRVRHLLKGACGSCYLEMQGILDGVKRTSSLVENLNGRLRKYMNLRNCMKIT